MSDESIKLVEFERFCEKCVYKDTEEAEDPCHECLQVGGRPFTHTPLYFEKNVNKLSRKKDKKKPKKASETT